MRFSFLFIPCFHTSSILFRTQQLMHIYKTSMQKRRTFCDYHEDEDADADAAEIIKNRDETK